MVRAFFVGVKAKMRNIEGSRYILPISVGQPYHEGERFEATIALLNRKGFQQGRIVVASILQRHTLGLIYKNLTEEELTKLAYEKGLEWQERNRLLLSKLNHPIEIVDWGFFLKTDAYKIRLQEMTQLYQEDSNFREKVDVTIDGFLNRWLSRDMIKESEVESSVISCKRYILEECSVASTWVGQGFHYAIYPSSLAPAMAEMYAQFILPSYPNELVWVRINLRGTTAIKNNKASRQTPKVKIGLA